MRISDWSSDVCSSDLKLDTVRKAFEARLVEIGNMDWEQSIEPVYEIFRRKVIEKSRVAYAPNPYIGGSDARDPEVVAVIGFAADDRHALVTPLAQAFYDYCGLEIGRESCRERRCQYVEI